MGRLPNHRFREQKREITTPESKLDSIKRCIIRPFSGTQRGQGFLTWASSEQSYNMGKTNRRSRADSEYEDMSGASSYGNGPTVSSHGSRRDGRGNTPNIGTNGGNLEDRGIPEAQTDLDFGPYTEAVEKLKQQMVASQRAMRDVNSLYTKHKLDIQGAIQTRDELEKMKNRCRGYRITIDSLREIEKERNEEWAKKVADNERERTRLNKAREETAEREREMEQEKENFVKRVRETEEKQKIELEEQRAKLETEQDEKYNKRVEILEKETKERQEKDEKRIADLEAGNNKLMGNLEEQKCQLRQAEDRCRDLERLKKLCEEEAAKSVEELKTAKNEFGLNTGTTKFYQEQFLKIYDDIQDISLHFFKELHFNDLKTIHDRIEQQDQSFALVPISTSEVSDNLRVAHAQRVISSHLRDIIWQPFSSEITLQDQNYVSLLGQISEGLVKSTQGSSSGPRAARVFTTLAMRGLGAQLPTSLSPSISKSSLTALPSRAKAFTDKVMTVLKLLVKQSLHPNLQNRLLDLANSAVSIWDVAQTDEREFTVYPTLEPASLDEWRSPFHKITTEDMSPPHDGVFVLFPRITARDCSRMADARATGPPGAWIDSEPDSHPRETYIHSGAGLGEWSALVKEGEEEEIDRKDREERKVYVEEKKMYEKKIENLDKMVTAPKRRASQGRRESFPGSRSNSSSPTAIIATWTFTGGQKIAEEED